MWYAVALMCCAFSYLQRLEDNTLSNLTLILHGRSMGKGYLIFVRKSASVVISPAISPAFVHFSLLKVLNLPWRRSLWSGPREDQRDPYSYNDSLNDPCDVFLDSSALLRTKFAFCFPPFSTRIRRGFVSARAEDPQPPCEDPRLTTQLSAGVGKS